MGPRLRNRALPSLLALCALSLPEEAWAWPVDVYLDLEAGAVHFERPSAITFAEVEDPKILGAEVLESGELLLTGVAAGRTLLLLYAEGKFALWRVRVSQKGAKARPVSAEAALAKAKQACPGLKVVPGAEEPELVAAVRDERCRQAVLGLLQTDAFRARQLDLTFEISALQTQLSSFQEGFAAAGLKGLEPRYLGATLALKGQVSAAGHRSALWELFRRSAGRVVLQDELEITP